MPQMPQLPELIHGATVHPVARRLPPAEWATKTPEFATLDPEHSFVVVVEDGLGGPVLARWAAFTVVHVEGLAMVPAVQGHAGVARALLATMVGELTGIGIQEVLTQADQPAVAEMCAKAGGHALPGQTWVIPLGVDGAADPANPPPAGPPA